MRAMILAAGRGERMGVLTTQTPKPLLRVGNHYLIEHTLASLKRAQIDHVVINVSYLGDAIMQALGDGSRYGLHITYSPEATRLETGGGILQALPLLGDEPFLVLSSDVITDFRLQGLPSFLDGLAHLVLVDNPDFHPHGDFGLLDGHVNMQATPKLTFGNIGVYHPDLFKNVTPGHFPLSKLLFPAIEAGKVTGEFYKGLWFNVGTAADLADMNQLAKQDALLTPVTYNS